MVLKRKKLWVGVFLGVMLGISVYMGKLWLFSHPEKMAIIKPKVPPIAIEEWVEMGPTQQEMQRMEQLINSATPHRRNEKVSRWSPNQLEFYSGSGEKRMVALTFDDGPDPITLKQVLRITKEKHVPATFFLLGSMAAKYPDLVKAIEAQGEGHVIANHSWNHPSLTQLSNAAISSQIERTNQVLRNIIGKEPLLFRPPYGAVNARVLKQIRNHHLKCIQWSVDTEDWRGRTEAQIMHSVKEHIQPGGIILQHTTLNIKSLQGSVAALPHMIDYLREQGYELVTIDKLLGTPAYQEIPQKAFPASKVFQN